MSVVVVSGLTVVEGKIKVSSYTIAGLAANRGNSELRQLDLEFWGQRHVARRRAHPLVGGELPPPLSPFFILHVEDNACFSYTAPPGSLLEQVNAASEAPGGVGVEHVQCPS